MISANSAEANSPLPLVFAGAGAVLFALVAVQLWLTGGVFGYALDDAYIHLALAENLPGTYSVNAAGGPGGAPSSSILYPYLLMPLAHTALGLYAPLLLNLIGAGIVLALLVRLEAQLNLFPTAGRRARAAMVLAVALALNLFALVLTGMEHTLHLAATLAVLEGLLALAGHKPPPRSFWLAIILGPLLRYEALALGVLALLLAAWRGYGKRAALVLLLMLAGPVAFSFYLMHLGYAALPSSVLSKSAPLTVGSEGTGLLTDLVALLFNAADNLSHPTAWLALLCMGLFAFFACRRGPLRVLALIGLLAGLAHLLLGKFGWFGRYQAYLLAINIVLLAVLLRPMPRGRIVLAVLLPVLGAASVFTTLQAPAAAAQIWRYHMTLHHFVAEVWQDDVAAYDIGALSWHNPHHVLDLFGLGSEQVRRLLRQPDAAEQIKQLISAEKIDLIIAEPSIIHFYTSPQWQDVGELRLAGPKIVTGLNPHFYLTNPQRLTELRAKLQAFRPALPAGVELLVR